MKRLVYYLWDSGCTNNEIGELFDVSYSREQIHCYENIVGGFGAKILALIHPHDSLLKSCYCPRSGLAKDVFVFLVSFFLFRN